MLRRRVFGRALVNFLRAYEIARGAPKAHAYNLTMYRMAGVPQTLRNAMKRLH